MPSPPEVFRTIEDAFSESRCVCTLCADGTLMVQLFDLKTNRDLLTVSGIHPECLNSPQAIEAFILELKAGVALGRFAIYTPNKN